MLSKHRDAQRALKKVAFWQELGPEGKAAVIGAVAAPLAGAAAQTGIDAIRNLMQSRNKARAYQDMVSMNPHLKSYDSNMSQMYFDSLHRVNPHLAGDPIAAGSFVHERHMMSTPGREHGGTIAGLVDVGKIRGPQSRPSPFVDAATSVAREIPGALAGVHKNQEIIKMRADYGGQLDAHKKLVSGLRMRDEVGGSAMTDYNKAQRVQGTTGGRMTGGFFQNNRGANGGVNKVSSFLKLAAATLR